MAKSIFSAPHFNAAAKISNKAALFQSGQHAAMSNNVSECFEIEVVGGVQFHSFGGGAVNRRTSAKSSGSFAGTSILFHQPPPSAWKSTAVSA